MIVPSLLLALLRVQVAIERALCLRVLLLLLLLLMMMLMG